MYTVDDCPHVGCKYCKFYKVNAEQAGVESTCKRIDHKVLKFAKPWFAVYDCGAWHIPCRDFEPKHPEYADFKAWTNFDDFWPVFVKAWLPYENENITVAFTLNDDDKVRYHVPLKLFMDGTMVKRGILRAIKKESKRGIEPINGVKIRTGKCIDRRDSK